MTFHVEFSEVDRESGVCTIMLSIGNIHVQSAPQAIADHFRDLEANTRFLKRRVLASLFFGEEPLLNLNYEDNSLMSAHVYRNSERGREKLRGEFLHNEAVAYLEGVLDALGILLKIMGLGKEELLDQVAQDIALGVYDVYLREPN